MEIVLSMLHTLVAFQIDNKSERENLSTELYGQIRIYSYENTLTHTYTADSNI